jgi:uncharacterized OB-fold protein
MTDANPVIVPEETLLTAPYWEGARNGELRIQRCTLCRVAFHPPQPVCPHCHSATNVIWATASGRGTVHAWTVVEHSAHPAVTAWLPYAVLLVKLDEGPLVITAPAVEADESDWPVGRRVRFTFDLIAGTEIRLPRVTTD